MTELPINLDNAQVNLDRLLEEARKTAKPELQDIPIARIVKDPALQVRESLKMPRVEEYKEILQQDPKRLPPIKAYYQAETDQYWVPDGYHRLAAHEALQLLLISALVVAGTRADAIVEAVGANATHGEPRTNADKRRAISTLLLESPAWQDASDRQIAKLCNLPDHKLVGVVAAALEAEGKIKPRGLRKGLDGRVIDTSNIGKPAETKSTGGIPQSEEAPKQPSLLIDSKTESSTKVFDVFEQADADAKAKKIASFERFEPEARPCQWHEGCDKQAIGPYRYCSTHFDAHLFLMRQEREKAEKEAKDLEASGELPRQEAPKTPAGWCHCGKRAFGDGQFCTEHAPNTSESLTAPTPEESVVRSLAASAPLHPKTLLPLPKEDRATSSEVAPKDKEESYQEWNTPEWLVALIKLFFGLIALDPCSNRWSLTKAHWSYTEKEDGLSVDWLELVTPLAWLQRLIYINPPYNNPMPWTLKAIEQAIRGAEMILCLPSSHSAEWWYLLAEACQAFGLMGKRVDFGREGVFNGACRHETTLFYFGPRLHVFRKMLEGTNPANHKPYARVIEGKPFVFASSDPRQGVLPVLVKPPQPLMGLEILAPGVGVSMPLCLRCGAKVNTGDPKALFVPGSIGGVDVWFCPNCNNPESISAPEPTPELNDWLERGLKSFEGLRTTEEVEALAQQLHAKATTDEERAKLQEAYETWRMRYPHAENVRRAKPTHTPNPNAKVKERGKKVEKEEACYCCETKHWLKQLRLIRGRFVCQACFDQRPPGDHKSIEGRSKSGDDIIRFGQTYKAGRNDYKVTEDEAAALKKDSRLGIILSGGGGGIREWEEPTYWIAEVAACDSEATLAQIERTYPLYLPKWTKDRDAEKELAELPADSNLRPMYQHFATQSIARKEGTVKLVQDIKDKRSSFSPPAPSTPKKPTLKAQTWANLLEKLLAAKTRDVAQEAFRDLRHMAKTKAANDIADRAWSEAIHRIEPDEDPLPTHVCLACGEPFTNADLFYTHQKRAHGAHGSIAVTIDGRTVQVTPGREVPAGELRLWLFGGAQEVWHDDGKKKRLMDNAEIWEVEEGEVFVTSQPGRNWLEEELKGLRAGTHLGERILELCWTDDQRRAVRRVINELTPPDNKKKPAPKAPKPKRVKGKNEEPLKPGKKARKR